MPWAPELFSAPALQRLEEKWGRGLVTVPFFDGVMSGELEALVGSFAGVPELHHPVRGRIRGARAFEAFVIETNAWLRRLNASVEDVERVHAGRGGLGKWCSTSTARPDESISRWRSWPTSGRMDGSRKCGCTTAAGR
jgi:hypothetical protein